MDDVDFDEEEESYILSRDDYRIIAATKALLWKVARSELVTPRQLEVIARALQVFEALPAVTEDYDIEVRIVGPRRVFGQHEIHHFWQVEIEDGRLAVTSQGHFYRPSTGGDTFTSMSWRAFPGFATEYEDFLDSIAIVDDAQPFDREVQSIDFAQGEYALIVSDDGVELCGIDEDEADEEADSAVESILDDDELPERLMLPEVVRSLEKMGAECVWANREMTALHTIELKELTLSDAAYKLFEHIPELQVLEARYTNISDRTLIFIRHLESLKWLCLRGTAVTDRGLQHLQGLTNLQHLDITEAPVMGPGLLYLQNLKNLSELYVSGLQDHDKWLEQIRRDLPDCEIGLM